MRLAILGVVLACLLAGSWYAATLGSRWRWVLAFIVVGVAWAALRELRQLLTPRLAGNGDRVVVGLAAGHRYEIPLDVVECFFLGQADTGLTTAAMVGAEARTVVVRLAEKASQWHRRDVPARWGHWCDGYITLRGTWCEPISVERVNALNHELAQWKRARRSAT